MTPYHAPNFGKNLTKGESHEITSIYFMFAGYRNDIFSFLTYLNNNQNQIKGRSHEGLVAFTLMLSPAWGASEPPDIGICIWGRVESNTCSLGKEETIMILRWHLVLGMILTLFLAFTPGSALALSGEELLDLMVEEGAITPEKAQKIKRKARKIDRKKKAEEDAKRARELQQVKEEAKAEAIKEAKAAAKAAVPKSKWKAYWKDGFKVESTDGKFKTKFGGRIQVDFASVSSPSRNFVDQVSNNEGSRLTGSGAEFRRARLFVQGTVYDDFYFKAQYDFADSRNGTVGFRDVYVGMQHLPGVGHIRVGHQKEPFSLEEQTSSKYITFMERALPNDFSPSRNTGIMAYNAPFHKRLYWGIGVFYDTDNTGAFAFNNYQNWNFTARLAGTPLYREKGRKLVHLGFSYSHQFRNVNAFRLRYRQRPEAHITSARTVNTGLTRINTNSINLINPEFALVWGPFSLQGEYMLSLPTASRDTQANRNLFLTGSNPTFQGAYFYGSYFLTGEHRKYKQSAAAFDRVKPHHNFSLKRGGWGAWEVAARWSYLNLQSKGVAGGIENDLTFGLNWYPTPNTRWMFNYVYASVSNRQVTPILPEYPYTLSNGIVHVAQTRFQIDF